MSFASPFSGGFGSSSACTSSNGFFEFNVRPITEPLTRGIRLYGTILSTGFVRFMAYEYKPNQFGGFGSGFGSTPTEAKTLCQFTEHTYACTIDICSHLGYRRDPVIDTWTHTIKNAIEIRNCLGDGIQGYTKVGDIIELHVKPDKYGRINEFRISLNKQGA